jgi:hypothetical protein
MTVPRLTSFVSTSGSILNCVNCQSQFPSVARLNCVVNYALYHYLYRIR